MLPPFYECRKIARFLPSCRKIEGKRVCRKFDWIGYKCRNFDALPIEDADLDQMVVLAGVPSIDRQVILNHFIMGASFSLDFRKSMCQNKGLGHLFSFAYYIPLLYYYK